MNDSGHIGDTADLYAIGALDVLERDVVERHVASCADCMQLLAAAEERVAMLVEADVGHAAPAQLERRINSLVRRRPSQLRQLITAIAAAMVIGLLPSAYFWQQNLAMHAAMTAEAEAIDHVASMPHRSAAFTGMSNGSAARVMYGPDGSWYVVVVRGMPRRLSVAWIHDGQRTMLGTATPHGETAMLYLPKSHRMDQLALLDGEQVVAEAQLAF
jgi:hypothetical protein